MLSSIPGISVCIPARNESATIADTIRSVTENYSGPNLELIVCSNACTDNTDDVVLNIAHQDPRVKLIHSEPGKPNAWNKLMATAIYNDIVFLDGDVLVAPGSVEKIVSFMHKYNYIAATAKIHKIVKSNWQAIFNHPLDSSTYQISGAMYSIRKHGLIAEMSRKGFTQMPTDIINEDHWLSLILETRFRTRILEKKCSYCPDAMVYHHIPNFRDECKQVKRRSQGKLQIKKEYPQLWYVDTESVSERFSRRYERWKRIDSVAGKIVSPFIFLLKKVMLSFARYEGYKGYLMKKHTNLWDMPSSTKVPFSKGVFKHGRVAPDGRNGTRKITADKPGILKGVDAVLDLRAIVRNGG